MHRTVRKILEYNGFRNVWLNKRLFVDKSRFLDHLQTRLRDQYCQVFYSSLFSDDESSNFSTKLRTYRNFKNEYKMESYLSAVKQFKFRKAMSKLRLSNHCLHIERGRYQNESLAN